MKYTEKIFKKENLIFGIIWATISYFVGTYIAQALSLIDKLLDIILQVTIFILLLPVKLSEYLSIENTNIIIVLGLIFAILLSPIVKEMYEWVKDKL